MWSKNSSFPGHEKDVEWYSPLVFFLSKKGERNDTVLSHIQPTQPQPGMLQDEAEGNAAHILDGLSYHQKA